MLGCLSLAAIFFMSMNGDNSQGHATDELAAPAGMRASEKPGAQIFWGLLAASLSSMVKESDMFFQQNTQS